MIDNTPEELIELVNNPKNLLMALNKWAILPRFNLSEHDKGRLMEQAINSSPKVQPIHNQAPTSVHDYWRYKMIYCRAKLELNLIDIIKKDASLNMDTQSSSVLDQHKAAFTGVRNVSFEKNENNLWGGIKP